MGLDMEEFPSTSSGILHGDAGASPTLSLWEWEQLCKEPRQEKAQCPVSSTAFTAVPLHIKQKALLWVPQCSMKRMAISSPVMQEAISLVLLAGLTLVFN